MILDNAARLTLLKKVTESIISIDQSLIDTNWEFTGYTPEEKETIKECLDSIEWYVSRLKLFNE